MRLPCPATIHGNGDQKERASSRRTWEPAQHKLLPSHPHSAAAQDCQRRSALDQADVTLVYELVLPCREGNPQPAVAEVYGINVHHTRNPVRRTDQFERHQRTTNRDAHS